MKKNSDITKPRPSEKAFFNLCAAMSFGFSLVLSPLRLCARSLPIAVLALAVWTQAALAAEGTSVSATLSSPTTTMGEPVELQISVAGTSKAQAPQVRVEGLEIKYVGPSSNSSFQFENGRIQEQSSIVHTYTVAPLKEGKYTIPALQIEVAGKKFATSPLTLTVASGAADSSQSENKFAFTEWVLPKATAYVGEALPVELWLYADPQIIRNVQPLPAVTGEGLMVQKVPPPQQRNVTKDGRNYIAVIYKTAMTPVKTGKLTLSPVDINAVANLPSKRQRTPRMQGFPDMDAFFNGALNMQSQQQVTIRTAPLEVEVKPLPVAGKPADFSGAIGQFTLETKAAPLLVHAGDPVTVTAVVKGVGSFDRMNAPTVAEESGWRTYPPSGKFKADDEVGISGSKTFEIAAIPETAKTELPKLTFSFFNPSTEKYETLTGDRIPLRVDGALAASLTPTPAAALAATTTASPSPAATPQPKASDIQYIRLDESQWGESFEPVWRTTEFWLVQLLPFTALLALGGWQWRRVKQSDGMARRAAGLRHAKAEALRVLRGAEAVPSAFYGAAIRALQIETALGQLRSGLGPEMVDADVACSSRPLACETAEGVRRLFAAHDELRYAGVGPGGSGGESVYPDQRAQVMQILEQFEKSHA